MFLNNLNINRIEEAYSLNQDGLVTYRINLSHPIGYKDQVFNTVHARVSKEGLCNHTIHSKCNNQQYNHKETTNIVSEKFFFRIGFLINTIPLTDVVIEYSFQIGKKAKEQYYDNTILSDKKAGEVLVIKIVELLLGSFSDYTSYWYSGIDENNTDSMRLDFLYE